ncbi:MAG: Maf family protein [Planctomycetota bacterium]
MSTEGSHPGSGPSPGEKPFDSAPLETGPLESGPAEAGPWETEPDESGRTENPPGIDRALEGPVLEGPGLEGPGLVLASASPRRKRLLEERGLEFRVLPADVDETIDLTLDAGDASEDLAVRKALAAAERILREGSGDESLLVLGSDTLVVLGEDGDPDRRFLEKAADQTEARAMLEALSGTRHRVVTGVAVVGIDGEDLLGPPRTGHGTTWVTMRPLDAAELDAYVASGEWRGKAGSYAIQETADRFVTALDGAGFDNVVGLPVDLALQLLGLA